MAQPDSRSCAQQSQLRLKILPSLLPHLPGRCLRQGSATRAIPPSPAPPSSSKEVPRELEAVSQQVFPDRSPRLECRAANQAGWELICVFSESRCGQAPTKPGVTDLNRCPKHRRSCCSSFGHRFLNQQLLPRKHPLSTASSSKYRQHRGLAPAAGRVGISGCPRQATRGSAQIKSSKDGRSAVCREHRAATALGPRAGCPRARKEGANGPLGN